MARIDLVRMGPPNIKDRDKVASDSLERIFWNPLTAYYNYGVEKSGEKVTYLNPAITYSA